MIKGLTPIVAIVLIILITVLGAVAVWHWVNDYVDMPAFGPVSIAMSVTDCNLSHVLVRNVGGVLLEKDADIYTEHGDYVGYLNISGFNVEPSQVIYVPIYNESENITVSEGIYKIIDEDYSDYIIYNCR